MANASFTYALQTSSVTLKPMISEDQNTLTVWFTLTAVAGTYTAGANGIPIDFTQLFALLAGGPGASLPTGALPLSPVQIQSAKAAGQANMYEYNFVPGTTLSNGGVQIFTGAAAQTALTELSTGALPAGVTGDIISGRVTFPKL